ncbi:MAG: hypothetical protein WAP35_09525 [Solirubrobacterales bacterium]
MKDSNRDQQAPNPAARAESIGRWTPIGIAFGVAGGLMLSNVIIGAVIGLAVGVAVGWAKATDDGS